MDAATRDRFAKVKALMASPNAGEASAAKARYAAMVERYGDPDATPDYGRFDPNFLGRRYDGVYQDRGAEPFPPRYEFVNRGAGGADFSTIFNDLFSYAQRSAAEEHRRTREDRVAQQLELGKECGRAVTFILDDLGLDVEGIAGGPWTIYDHTDDSHGPFDMRGVIDFARARGFR